MNQPAIINERLAFLKQVLPFTYLLSGSTAEFFLDPVLGPFLVHLGPNQIRGA